MSTTPVPTLGVEDALAQQQLRHPSDPEIKSSRAASWARTRSGADRSCPLRTHLTLRLHYWVMGGPWTYDGGYELAMHGFDKDFYDELVSTIASGVVDREHVRRRGRVG